MSVRRELDQVVRRLLEARRHVTVVGEPGTAKVDSIGESSQSIRRAQNALDVGFGERKRRRADQRVVHLSQQRALGEQELLARERRHLCIARENVRRRRRYFRHFRRNEYTRDAQALELVAQRMLRIHSVQNSVAVERAQRLGFHRLAPASVSLQKRIRNSMRQERIHVHDRKM